MKTVPASTSVAVAVVTTVVFSGMEIAAVAPPPFEVKTGASLALSTVTAKFCTSVKTPSETVICTSYTLFPPASLGFSKSCAAIKAKTPVVALIVNNAASAPPAIE